jgi:hypothetical protein
VAALDIPTMQLKRRGVELRMIVGDHNRSRATVDLPLLKAVARAHRWFDQLSTGKAEVAGREHRQPIGGRIDFLMRDAEAETYYGVEVMLGALDESHIIRTIEYWDIERQRRPQFEHRAVIVAEQITSRFFNVLRLLNRVVPMIAAQLSAFRIDESIVLHAVTVLDVVEEIADVDVDPVLQADRAYWQKTIYQLLAQDEILGLKPRSSREPRPDSKQQQGQKRDHRPLHYHASSCTSSRTGFSGGTTE